MATQTLTPTSPEDFAKLEQDLQAAQKRHRTGDSWYYNGGTVLILLFTGTASLLPTIKPNDHPVALAAQILAALAAFLVAMERSLDFGARWRFHIEMDNAYSALIGRIKTYQVAAQALPDPQRTQFWLDFMDQRDAVSKREAGMPVGT